MKIETGNEKEKEENDVGEGLVESRSDFTAGENKEASHGRSVILAVGYFRKNILKRNWWAAYFADAPLVLHGM
jgi:hypothetical protein